MGDLHEVASNVLVAVGIVGCGLLAVVIALAFLIVLTRR